MPFSAHSWLGEIGYDCVGNSRTEPLRPLSPPVPLTLIPKETAEELITERKAVSALYVTVQKMAPLKMKIKKPSILKAVTSREKSTLTMGSRDDAE